MISCIIPAAGVSKRMGSWKPMLPVEGRPMLFSVIDALLPMKLPITVVTGYRGDELSQIIKDAYPSVSTVHNPDFSKGMYSSVITGLSVCGASDDVLITPADMPLLRSPHVEALLSRWERSSADVIRPKRDGVPGHPVICSARVCAYALSHPNLRSMQEAAAKFSCEAFASNDDAYYTDADTPDEYRRLNS